MPRQLTLLIISTLCAISSLMAQRVDTLHVFSPSMQKAIPNLVILPESYDRTQRYPVIYLLHGHGGNYNSWLRQSSPNCPT